jgi:hypothetical protein
MLCPLDKPVKVDTSVREYAVGSAVLYKTLPLFVNCVHGSDAHDKVTGPKSPVVIVLVPNAVFDGETYP